MLHDLSNSGKCRELIRMSQKAFMTLCSILKRDGGLRATQRMSVEEQVARFLHIVAMIMEQDKGNRINGTFTSQAYNNIIEELNTKLQMNITKNHLKNRLKTLKEHFSQWYDMFRGTSLSGFSWNSNTQLIEVEDEVWEKLIDSKPEAVMLKTKKVSNYYEMLEVFSKDRASGAHAETAKERNDRYEKIGNIKVETITEVDELLEANEVTLENQHSNYDDVQVLDSMTSPPEQSSSAKKYKSKKRKVEQEDEVMESRLMDSINNVANAIQEGNKILERVYHQEYTGEEIYKQLEPMCLEPNEIPDAMMFLAENQAKARLLFSCPFEIRMGMLKKMMGGGGLHTHPQLGHCGPNVAMCLVLDSEFHPYVSTTLTVPSCRYRDALALTLCLHTWDTVGASQSDSSASNNGEADSSRSLMNSFCNEFEHAILEAYHE
ncbi:hypothetical protein E3N88_07333 [Mikania micrantha]|uniref:Myb/SANT-like domain-containing protein n=1 Tax=Mikania micrantha TaxID=192012 RepID=A0A5N6PTD1_9ASTR|nr:hypothetical protein E3N88_07333 [Mikania micrantha]